MYSAFILSSSSAPASVKGYPDIRRLSLGMKLLARCSSRRRTLICDRRIYWQRVLRSVLPAKSRTQITPGARICTYSYFVCVCADLPYRVPRFLEARKPEVFVNEKFSPLKGCGEQYWHWNNEYWLVLNAVSWKDSQLFRSGVDKFSENLKIS